MQPVTNISTGQSGSTIVSRRSLRMQRSHSVAQLASGAAGLPEGHPLAGAMGQEPSLLKQPAVLQSTLSQGDGLQFDVCQNNHDSCQIEARLSLSRWPGLSSLNPRQSYALRAESNISDNECSPAEANLSLSKWSAIGDLSHNSAYGIDVRPSHCERQTFEVMRKSFLSLVSSMNLSVIDGCDFHSSHEPLHDTQVDVLKKPASLRCLRLKKSDISRLDGLSKGNSVRASGAADGISSRNTSDLQLEINSATVRVIRSSRREGIGIVGANCLSAAKATGCGSHELGEALTAVTVSTVNSGETALAQTASESFLVGSAKLAVEVTGATVSNTILTSTAQSKLNKVKRRKKIIDKAYAIKADRKKELLSRMSMEQIAVKDLTFLELFDSTKSDAVVNWLQFKQYAEVCYLESAVVSDPLTEILKQNGGCISPASLLQLIVDCIRLSDESTGVNLQLLFDFVQDLNKDPKGTYGDKNQLKLINKALAPLGIVINYETDRIFGSIRKNAIAIGHRLNINKEKLFETLVLMDKLPTVQSMDQIICKYSNVIDALYSCRTYDDWKLHQYRVDRNIKLMATAISAIPIATGIDGAILAAAYGREIKYRQGNEDRTLDRISYALGYVKTLNAGWRQDELDEITQLLSAVEKVKEMHIDNKKALLGFYVGVHVAGAVIDPLSNVIGPIGTSITSSVKSTSKNIAAMSAAVDRIVKDNSLRQQSDFAESKDVYSCYKSLYQAALDDFNFEKIANLQNLAYFSFGISPECFDALVRTELVETNRFKLSFAHKVVK